MGDRASMAILGLVCVGTFAALLLTSAAKRANLTGPPAKEERPQAAADFQRHLEEQLRSLDTGRRP